MNPLIPKHMKVINLPDSSESDFKLFND